MTAQAAPLRPVAVSAGRSRWRAVSGSTVVTALAVGWLVVVVVSGLLPGLIAADDPTQVHAERALQAPGETPLGTDQYGRSIATLLVHGAGTALTIGLQATVVGLVVGSLIGLLAGYVGGIVDLLIGRVVDVLMCFPGVLLALVITVALGPTRDNLVLAVGIATIPAFARVMRGQVLAVRGRLYVEAARSVGLSGSRILLHHVLPNATAPVVVLATVSVGTAIVAAASLSFLGLGPQSEVPDWGQLLATGQPYLANAWWISTFPGLVLTATVIAVSLLGDWLRDRLDLE